MIHALRVMSVKAIQPLVIDNAWRGVYKRNCRDASLCHVLRRQRVIIGWLVQVMVLCSAFASVASAQATTGTGMCLTGLTPWVSACAAGMKGDGYTTNQASGTTSTTGSAIQVSGSPNYSNASVGQLVWIYGGGLSAPAGVAPSYSSGNGTLSSSPSLCVQLSYVTKGGTTGLMTSESAPSPETSCASPSAGSAITVSAPSGVTSPSGVSAYAYGVYIGPTNAETLQNPNVSLNLSGATGNGTTQKYTLNVVSG